MKFILIVKSQPMSYKKSWIFTLSLFQIGVKNHNIVSVCQINMTKNINTECFQQIWECVFTELTSWWLFKMKTEVLESCMYDVS